jgi:ribosomal protein S18 acetylase RimI-like enzyme
MFNSKQKNKSNPLKDITINYEKDISAEAVQQLYLSVGWQFRDCFEIKKSIDRSYLVASAWLRDSLVGFARATGDGIYSVTIWDFAIKPSFQKRGIGKLLLNSMLQKLNSQNIPLITLYSELDKKNFYSKLGFECDSKKIIAMYKYNK